MTDDLGPLRIVRCIRCGKDKWRGPSDLCADCLERDAQAGLDVLWAQAIRQSRSGEGSNQ
jgi:hypothetical protein